MPTFHIGRYEYNASPYAYYIHSRHPADLLDAYYINRVTFYDDMLHQSLDRIFREHYLGSSDQIKEFIRGLKHDDQESIMKPTLEQEPVLSWFFSKEELRKLSLLWISVLASYKKSAELLVRFGADVNEPFGRHDPQVIDEKWTVLHVLLQMGFSPENELLVRLVTDHGADLQARDHRERTVLHYAVEKNPVQVTEMLLEKGADVNTTDDDGMTPLLVAAVNTTEAKVLIPLLIKHGADVFANTRRGSNALHFLAFGNLTEHAVELAKFFIEKGVSPFDEKIENQTQPIHRAAMSGNHELVKLFLDHGVHVNVQNGRGESPLYRAARYCSRGDAVIETLLKFGANINLRTTDCQTALHGACEKSAGIRLPAISSDEWETFVGSIRTTIDLLLSAGADVLAQDSDGDTPLTWILSGGNVVEMEPPGIRLLIKKLALKKALQPSIKLKDERDIERHQKLHDYYRDCIDEIDRMKSTRFIHTCTVFELLVKSHCQIAALMRNPEFETKFKQYDLNGFSNHAEDIRRAFECAQKHYRAMLEQENVIHEALYDMLPYVVVRRVVHYIYNDC